MLFVEEKPEYLRETFFLELQANYWQSHLVP
jgi:hypothetical protein